MLSNSVGNQQCYFPFVSLHVHQLPHWCHIPGKPCNDWDYKSKGKWRKAQSIFGLIQAGLSVGPIWIGTMKYYIQNWAVRVDIGGCLKMKRKRWTGLLNRTSQILTLNHMSGLLLYRSRTANFYYCLLVNLKSYINESYWLHLFLPLIYFRFFKQSFGINSYDSTIMMFWWIQDWVFFFILQP